MSGYNRRDFMKTTAAAALFPRLALGQDGARRRPNVVILLIDDLGFGDLGCFGNRQAPTPHIDSMAAGGARCTMTYITNPPCSPSRSGVMTGMYVQRFGKSGMSRGLPIPEDHPTMAEFMRDAGYVTGMIGKWDLGSASQGPHKRGFMEVARYAPGEGYDCTREDGTPVYRTDLDGDYMAEFVERNKDQPFFLYFAPLAIHVPHDKIPRRYMDRVEGGQGTPYQGTLAALDDAIGKLLATLRKHDIEEDTLIFLTSDNGASVFAGGSSAPYRGGKGRGHTIYDGWVHPPAIVSWPGTIAAGTTYDGLMCTMDFYATAAAVAERPLPKRCEGHNVLPYLTEETAGDVHEYLYWHNADPTDFEHRNLYAVRWKHWRLVKHPDGWRLFDLQQDPGERHNLASAHADIVSGMRRRYDAWVATLPPLKEGGSRGVVHHPPTGWGWVFHGEVEDQPAVPKRRRKKRSRQSISRLESSPRFR